MSATFTVDFSEVLPVGVAAPKYAVADIIPISVHNRGEQPRLSVVLDLQRRTKQMAKHEVLPGTFLVRVKAPTGEELAEHIEVLSEDREWAISFERPSTVRVGSPRPPVVESLVEGSDFSSGLQDPRAFRELPTELSHQTSPRRRADRSRWTAMRLVDLEGQATIDSLPKLRVGDIVQPKQGNMGIVRLQGGAFEEGWQWPDGVDRASESRRLVGDIRAMQPTKLYGAYEQLAARWKQPIRDARISSRDEREGRSGRFFALSYHGEDGMEPLQVACIPGEWKTFESSRANVNLELRAEGERDSYRLELSIDDPVIGAMLSALQTGDAEATLALFDHARETLYWKYRNPYAAAVGGYVLLYAGFREHASSPQHQVDQKRWGQWILNLARDFQGLPDGMILYATLLLQGPRSEREDLMVEGNGHFYERAHAATMEALRRGPPLYRFGLKFMASNLRILAAKARRDSGIARELERAQRHIHDLVLRVDPRQPFCVFDVSRG